MELKTPTEWAMWTETKRLKRELWWAEKRAREANERARELRERLDRYEPRPELEQALGT